MKGCTICSPSGQDEPYVEAQLLSSYYSCNMIPLFRCSDIEHLQAITLHGQ